jgi:hypothetical protein
MIIGDIKSYLQRIDNRLASIESYISEIRDKNTVHKSWQEIESDKNKQKFFKAVQQGTRANNWGNGYDR